MRLLRLAVESQRWDLAAHTIVLATARILQNGDQPRISRRVNNPSIRIPDRSGVERMIKSGGRELAREKRRTRR